MTFTSFTLSANCPQIAKVLYSKNYKERYGRNRSGQTLAEYWQLGVHDCGTIPAAVGFRAREVGENDERT